MSNTNALPPQQGPLFVRPSGGKKRIPIINPYIGSSLDKTGSGSASQHYGSAGLVARDGHRPLTASNSLASDHLKDINELQRAKAHTQHWIANVYARPYIPKSLSAINSSPVTVTYYGTPIAGINFSVYVSSFAGRQYLTPCVPVEPLVSKPLTPITFPLTETNYEIYFGGALAIEFGAEGNAITSHNMYKVQLYSRNSQDKLYELQVPGLREDAPRADLGDSIILRQLRIDPRTNEPLGMEQWLAPGGGMDRGFPAPGFYGTEHNVFVWGLDRAKEKIVLKINNLVDQALIFNVIFRVQPRRFEPFQRAIVDVNHQLSRTHGSRSNAETTAEHSQGQAIRDSDTFQGTYRSELGSGINGHTNELENFSTARTWMRRMLFPVQSDGVEQEGLPKARFMQNWFDSSLNYEQQKSVDSIQQQIYGSIPFLISGPPGTGKTKTIVETALQLIYRTSIFSTRTHILLCAPSDPAADVLALRILEAVPDQNLYKDLFRLNSSSRSFAEVPGKLLPYCHIANEQFSLPDFCRLMNYRMVITTCRDADILVQARVTNRDLVSLEKGITDALHFGDNIDEFKAPLHWSALLIDEAGQATEPEAGIPLTVVVPPEEGSVGNVIVVMAGDQYQLGPRLFSQEIALKTSLFERLFEREIYREHPLSRKRANEWKGSIPGRSASTKDVGSMIHPPFANLFRNYRSHPAILSIPSALFYNDTLISEATGTEGMKGWSGWNGRRWPVLLACNIGGDERDLEGWGWYNRREVKKACDFAKSLVDEGLIEERDVCIMSPFQAQVQRLRRTIRDEPYKLRGVNIGPLEAFQGLESRFVIICTTRTQRRHLVDDHAHGLGMINEAKRFNVAMTRAKQGLIVIGNPSALQQDNSWNAFIKFCWRHQLWEEDLESQRMVDSKVVSNMDIWTPSDEATAPYISSLERGLIYKENLDGCSSLVNPWPSVTNEDDAMWVSGHVAEDALREY